MGLNLRIVIRILAVITGLISLAMLPSLAVSLLYREADVSAGFLQVIVPTGLLSTLILLLTRKSPSAFHVRECFLTVSLSWVIASLAGAFPYLAAGVTDSFVDAFFESASGFTTTGATIFENVELLPRGILFWRSFSQWIGGMGILIFAISLLPMLGISGQLMAKIETPGPTLNKVAPRMTDSAKILYIIYIGITTLEVIMLLPTEIGLFDALIAAFGSVSAGGFSNYNDGIHHFGNLYIESIVAVFTLFVCVNFTLYYSLLRGKWRDFFANVELRTFAAVLSIAAVLVGGGLWKSGIYGSPLESLRYGLLEVVSFLTTTGHRNAQVAEWPAFCKTVLFLLMMIGACSASTGGGIKVIRVLVLFKHIRRGFYRKLHPRAVLPIKIQGRPIPADSIAGILAFLYLYIFVFIGSALLLSLENLDLAATFTLVASILNNTGNGFDLLGPDGLYTVISAPGKIYLCFLMIMGRLELFTILVLFTRSFWSSDR